ncbi:MAG: hypothetical protein AAFR17_20265 [Pseudomonadota bacterium]
MPRIFVNALANFAVQGGMVSFTLQDRRGPTGQGQVPPPEDVADITMTEAEFVQMLTVFEQNRQGFEQQMGRPLGAAQPGMAPKAPGPAPTNRAGGMKIRPKA